MLRFLFFLVWCVDRDRGWSNTKHRHPQPSPAHGSNFGSESPPACNIILIFGIFCSRGSGVLCLRRRCSYVQIQILCLFYHRLGRSHLGRWYGCPESNTAKLRHPLSNRLLPYSLRVLLGLFSRGLVLLLLRRGG